MIKILIVDDHLLMRQGISRIFVEFDDFEVVGEAANGRQAVELTRSLSPDVVIMDISMPEMNGIEATKKILAEGSNSKVIALSMHIDRLFVMEMLKAGASGYLLKDCAFEELEAAIRIVTSGKTYLSPLIANVVVKDYVNISTGEARADFGQLTDREREVLQLIAEGVSTKQIAFKLDVSVKTIETHRRNIMKKLEAKSIADLVKHGIRMGLTSLE